MSYVKAILLKKNAKDADGKLRPFTLQESNIECSVSPMQVSYFLALSFVLNGANPPYVRRAIDILRWLVVEDLTSPLAVCQAEENTLLNIFKAIGVSDKKKLAKAMSATRDFSLALVDRHFSNMPMSKKDLVELPYMEESFADVILRDCFGVSCGILVTKLNRYFIIAAGLVDYEKSFFHSTRRHGHVGHGRPKQSLHSTVEKEP